MEFDAKVFLLIVNGYFLVWLHSYDSKGRIFTNIATFLLTFQA